LNWYSESSLIIIVFFLSISVRSRSPRPTCFTGEMWSEEKKLVEIGPGPGPDQDQTVLRSRPVPVRSGPGPAQKPTCGPVLVLVLKKLAQDQTGPDRDIPTRYTRRTRIPRTSLNQNGHYLCHDGITSKGSKAV